MIDTYSIIYSPEARDDLKDIYSYIAFDLLVPGIAEGQVNRIRKTIRSKPPASEAVTLSQRRLFFVNRPFVPPRSQILNVTASNISLSVK